MVASKVTSFKVGKGENQKTVVVTLQDLGLSLEEISKIKGDRGERAKLTARVRKDIESDADAKKQYKSASLSRQSKREDGEKAKPPMTLREEKAPDFLSPREQRRIKYAPQVKNAAKRIVDEIDKTPQTRPDQKRFEIRIGKAGKKDLMSEAVYLYGRERKFDTKTGSMGGSGDKSMGLMVQNIAFKKSMQGLGVFDAMVSEYQSRHPDRGVFIEIVSNKKWEQKLERPNSGWQRTPDWGEGNKNYWKPPLVTTS